MRIFLAYPVPPDVGRELLCSAQLAVGDVALRWVPLEQLHVTLQFYGEQPDAFTEELRARIQKMDVSPFEVETGTLRRFGRSALGYELRRVDELKASPHAKPLHVTVARCKARLRLPPSTKGERVRFSVDRIRLYASALTPDGSIYTVLAESAPP